MNSNDYSSDYLAALNRARGSSRVSSKRNVKNSDMIKSNDFSSDYLAALKRADGQHHEMNDDDDNDVNNNSSSSMMYDGSSSIGVSKKNSGKSTMLKGELRKLSRQLSSFTNTPDKNGGDGRSRSSEVATLTKQIEQLQTLVLDYQEKYLSLRREANSLRRQNDEMQLSQLIQSTMEESTPSSDANVVSISVDETSTPTAEPQPQQQQQQGKIDNLSPTKVPQVLLGHHHGELSPASSQFASLSLSDPGNSPPYKNNKVDHETDLHSNGNDAPQSELIMNVKLGEADEVVEESPPQANQEEEEVNDTYPGDIVHENGDNVVNGNDEDEQEARRELIRKDELLARELQKAFDKEVAAHEREQRVKSPDIIGSPKNERANALDDEAEKHLAKIRVLQAEQRRHKGHLEDAVARAEAHAKHLRKESMSGNRRSMSGVNRHLERMYRFANMSHEEDTLGSEPNSRSEPQRARIVNVSAAATSEEPMEGSADERLRNRLVAFYEQYNPTKLKDGGAHVERVIRHYRGREDVLFKELHQKYMIVQSSSEAPLSSPPPPPPPVAPSHPDAASEFPLHTAYNEDDGLFASDSSSSSDDESNQEGSGDYGFSYTR